MVEIYKVIAYCIPLLDQIFYDNHKNASIKEAHNNQVYAGILNLLAFVGVFLIMRKIVIYDIHFVSNDNNPSH